MIKEAVWHYTACTSSKGKIKNKNIFLLTNDFPFYFKDFFSYTTLYLHGLVIFTQNEQVALCN